MTSIQMKNVTSEENVIGNPVVTQLGARRVSHYYGDYSAVELTWDSVCVDVSVRKGVLCFTKDLGKKNILQNVSGYAKCGSLLAIMGSSGCGKSTLLDALSGRTRSSMSLKGTICANGKHLGFDIAHISSYIQQEDLFIGTMTVRESLQFQASLRLGHLSKSEKNSRVAEIIKEGELTKVADSIIGTAGGSDQCLSGGERKRLSLAIEVLLGKPLIFADEPTSGLDASMAERIVLFLQKLAHSNRTVIVTIHQPSSDVFSLFDNICLLTNGETAYFGPRKGAPPFFASQGHTCPPDYNPADFYIKTLSASTGEITSAVTQNAEEGDPALPSVEIHTAMDNNYTLYAAKKIVSGFEKSQECKDVDDISNELNSRYTNQTLRINKSGRVSYFTEFCTIMWRNIKILTRNPVLNHIRVFQHVAVAIFFGLAFLQTEESLNTYPDICGCLFLIVYMLSLFGVFNNIQVLPTELPLFVREYQSGTYSIATWYIAKALIEIPACIVLPLIFNLICYFMIFPDPVFAKFMVLWMICALSIMASTSIAYFVSVIGWEPLNTLAIAPTIYAPHFLFCGQFIKISNVKDWMRPIQETSWLRYGYEAAIVGHFNDAYYNKPINSTRIGVIGNLGMDKDALWFPDVAGLLLLTFGFHFFAFLILLLRSKNR